MIRRNKFPRFIGVADTGEMPGVSDIRWMDERDETDREKAEKKAIEFLRKGKYMRI